MLYIDAKLRRSANYIEHCWNWMNMHHNDFVMFNVPMYHYHYHYPTRHTVIFFLIKAAWTADSTADSLSFNSSMFSAAPCFQQLHVFSISNICIALAIFLQNFIQYSTFNLIIYQLIAFKEATIQFSLSTAFIRLS